MQLSNCIVNVLNQYETSKTFLVWSITPNMRVTYHCLPCNKEFIEIHMAKEHSDSTGHEFMEREL